MAKFDHDTLVELYQDKRIDILQFIMNGEDADDFLQFCLDRRLDPSTASANLFLSLKDREIMESQQIANELYGCLQ